MSAHCPDCLILVPVPPQAKEGRCVKCRPRPYRPHSVPRRRKGEDDQTVGLVLHTQ